MPYVGFPLKAGQGGAIQTDVEKPTLSQREKVGVRVAQITSLFAL
jgi:hypothetical protein